MANKETVSPPPFRLPDRFEFLNKTLAGGQAFVYLCRDKFLDRQVALKAPKSPITEGAVRKELAILSGLKSKHVTQVYDVLEDKKSGHFAIVEEFVPGPTLEEYVERTNIQKEDFLRILYQLACALSDIHAAGKVHRDVTPRNVKFDAESVLKILDFGLSSVARPEGVTPQARGTPGFVGPEFYGSLPAHFSAAADVYGFGATAWFMALNGVLPPSLLEVPPQSLTAAPSFSTAGMSLPIEIVEVLNATLLPNPSRRPHAPCVRDTLKRHLLFGRHRATIHYEGKTYVLSDQGKAARLPAGNDTITVKYSGLAFVVAAVTGDVYINNNPAKADDILPDACVITLGAPPLKQARKFVPVNMSHPEVVL
jgi:serine/threonine-protein kinase